MSTFDLAGHRILVTGATSGLGRDMALQLAVEHGAQVLATGRREERLAELVATGTGAITPHACDIADPFEVRKLCARAAEDGLDGVILNAGVTHVGAFETADYPTYAQMISTNVTANIQLLLDLLPTLRESRKGPGRVLLVTSLAGITPSPYQAVYAGSKAFMVNFGLSLRSELKGDNVVVTVFTPGGIKTEMTDVPELKSFGSALKSPAKVARSAIAAYASGKACCAPGVADKVSAGLVKLLPRSWMTAAIEKGYRDAIEGAGEG